MWSYNEVLTNRGEHAKKSSTQNSEHSTNVKLEQQSSRHNSSPRTEIHLPNINLNSVGQQAVDNRDKTATLENPRTLHHSPPPRTSVAVGIKAALPLGLPKARSSKSLRETCHICGGKFGSLSIGVHEKECQKKLKSKHHTVELAMGPGDLNASAQNKVIGDSVLRNTHDSTSIMEKRFLMKTKGTSPILQVPSSINARNPLQRLSSSKIRHKQHSNESSSRTSTAHGIRALQEMSNTTDDSFGRNLIETRSVQREPFSDECRHCGIRFGRHSIAVHERRCRQRPETIQKISPIKKSSCRSEPAASETESHSKNATKASSPRQSQLKTEPGDAYTFDCQKPQSDVVASIVTVGLGPAQFERIIVHRGPHLANLKSSVDHQSTALSRPTTRTLYYSSLNTSGHGLPLYDQHGTTSTANNVLACGKRTFKSNHIQCEDCGKVITADRLGVHQRICQRDSIPQHVSTGSVTLPSMHNLLRVDSQDTNNGTSYSMKSSKRNDRDSAPKVSRGSRPPTVVCYICGREYGTKSISIHEPQCMRKWQAENKQKPISERRSLPKKPEQAKIARVVSREDMLREIKDTLPERRALGVLCEQDDDSKSTHEAVQGFFEQCYAEFQKELLPCKNCGRTFAPERHRKHEPNCNTEPLRA